MNVLTTKIVLHANMARYLVKKGHRIIDLKPDKYEKLKTIFVFEVDSTLLSDMNEFARGENRKEIYSPKFNSSIGSQLSK